MLNIRIYTIVTVILYIALANYTYSQKKTEFTFSIKGSYHTADRPNEFDGFNSGFLLDVSSDVRTIPNLFVSANLLFGKATDNNFPIPQQNNITREYSFFGINGILKYKLLAKKFGFSVGIGLGNMNIRTESIYGNEKLSYLNISFPVSFGYIFTRSAMLEFEICYSHLINYLHNNKMVIFKLGPTILIN